MVMLQDLNILMMITMIMIMISMNIGDAIGLDDVDDYDDEEFGGTRFHGISKKYERVCDYCHYRVKYRATTHSICNLRYKRPQILVVFYNGSNYDYHFIIKQLVEDFDG